MWLLLLFDVVWLLLLLLLLLLKQFSYDGVIYVVDLFNGKIKHTNTDCPSLFDFLLLWFQFSTMLLLLVCSAYIFSKCSTVNVMCTFTLLTANKMTKYPIINNSTLCANRPSIQIYPICLNPIPNSLKWTMCLCVCVLRMIEWIGFHCLLTYGSQIDQCGNQLNFKSAYRTVESTLRFRKSKKIFNFEMTLLIRHFSIHFFISNERERPKKRERVIERGRERKEEEENSGSVETDQRVRANTQNFIRKRIGIGSRSRVFSLVFVGYILYIQSTCFRPLTWYYIHIRCIVYKFSLCKTAISFSMKVA